MPCLTYLTAYGLNPSSVFKAIRNVKGLVSNQHLLFAVWSASSTRGMFVSQCMYCPSTEAAELSHHRADAFINKGINLSGDIKGAGTN